MQRHTKIHKVPDGGGSTPVVVSRGRAGPGGAAAPPPCILYIFVYLEDIWIYFWRQFSRVSDLLVDLVDGFLLYAIRQHSGLDSALTDHNLLF